MSIADKLQTIAENEQKVYDAGEQAEQKRFWEEFQMRGTRTTYTCAFAYSAWKDDIYNPIYPITVVNGNQLFQQTYITDTKVPIDISNAGVNHASLFAYTSRIETIRKFITRADKSYSGDFTSCSGLKNITFEGEIGRSIDFSDCPLTVESMKSVITHLVNYAGTENQDKYTVKFSSTCWSNLEADSTAPDDNTWQDYVSSLGWLT